MWRAGSRRRPIQHLRCGWLSAPRCNRYPPPGPRTLFTNSPRRKRPKSCSRYEREIFWRSAISASDTGAPFAVHCKVYQSHHRIAALRAEPHFMGSATFFGVFRLGEVLTGVCSRVESRLKCVSRSERGGLVSIIDFFQHIEPPHDSAGSASRAVPYATNEVRFRGPARPNGLSPESRQPSCSMQRP